MRRRESLNLNEQRRLSWKIIYTLTTTIWRALSHHDLSCIPNVINHWNHHYFAAKLTGFHLEPHRNPLANVDDWLTLMIMWFFISFVMHQMFEWIGSNNIQSLTFSWLAETSQVWNHQLSHISLWSFPFSLSRSVRNLFLSRKTQNTFRFNF